MKNSKKITPEEVGKKLGISPATVRKEMENGSLPIGTVVNDGERKTYIIYPKPLYEVTGIKMNGYEPPAPVIDYQKLASELWKILNCLNGKECACNV